MITAFNALLECIVTGLFTAVFLGILSRLGMFPLMYLTFKKPEPEEDDFYE